VKITGLIVSFAYMAALFMASSLPDKAGSKNILSDVPSLFQNFLHIPAFGVLTLLWIRILKTYRIRYRLAIMVGAGIALLYGAGLEIYQATVPGRFPSMVDLLLNLVGIFLSVLIYNLFYGRNTFGVFKW